MVTLNLNLNGCDLGDVSTIVSGCEIPLDPQLCSNINGGASGYGNWSANYVSNGNGVLSFDFYTATVPDQLIVTVNGNVVADSGNYSSSRCSTSYAGCNGTVNPGCGSDFLVDIPVSYLDDINVTVFGNTCNAQGTYWSLDAFCDSNFKGGHTANRSDRPDDAHFFTDIAVFPNPTRDVFTVTLPDNRSYDMSIINTIGEIVYRTSKVTGEKTVSTKDFGVGVYLVTLQNVETGKITSKKIIVTQ